MYWPGILVLLTQHLFFLAALPLLYMSATSNQITCNVTWCIIYKFFWAHLQKTYDKKKPSFRKCIYPILLELTGV